MSLKAFGPNDIILNTMKAHPSCEFFVFDGKIYYNNEPSHAGAFSSQVLNVPLGHISLYEYNIDKLSGSNNFIYPFVYKDSSRDPFRSISSTAMATAYGYGDIMSGTYPMSASITREFMSGAAGTKILRSTTDEIGRTILYRSPKYRHFYALKNRLNYYGIKSQYYKVSSSYGDKSLLPVNLISIPAIFYGSQIKPGSLSLKWYFTGSLIGELQDTKQNGELIEVSGSNVGSVAGVVLYDEGFVLLTGSWALNSETIRLISGSAATATPQWLYFGAGANDDVTQTTVGDTTYTSASFNLSFKGTTKTQVMTMFAHAARGEVNYSSNPTFLTYGQSRTRLTSSQIYEENPSRTIKNVATSSYSDYSASFKRQVYVSRVAIYDDNKNLLGIATLSNPVLKKEDEDLAFKIRLDI